MRLILIVIVVTLAAVGAVSLWTSKGTSDFFLQTLWWEQHSV